MTSNNNGSANSNNFIPITVNNTGSIMGWPITNIPASGGIPIGASITISNSGWFFTTVTPTEQEEDSTESKGPVDPRDGLDCSQCKEFYPYAVANKNDGTLVCYKCRNGL